MKEEPHGQKTSKLKSLVLSNVQEMNLYF